MVARARHSSVHFRLCLPCLCLCCFLISPSPKRSWFFLFVILAKLLLPLTNSKNDPLCHCGHNACRSICAKLSHSLDNAGPWPCIDACKASISKERSGSPPSRRCLLQVIAGASGNSNPSSDGLRGCCRYAVPGMPEDESLRFESASTGVSL